MQSDFRSPRVAGKGLIAQQRGMITNFSTSQVAFLRNSIDLGLGYFWHWGQKCELRPPITFLRMGVPHTRQGSPVRW